MLALKVSVLCLTTPIAVLYGLHAWRHAPERALACIGLVLSLIVLVPFGLVMIGDAMGLASMLCR
jgi:hypothetical protein